MSFFRQFPKVDYNFSEAGFDTLVTDIFRFVQADLPAISDSTTYQYYQVQDGDRPDIVSNKLYGTPDYYWTFFLCNESLKTGLTGWPMSQNQFDKYILAEYDGTALITYPSSPVYNTDGSQIIAQYNSLAGKFIIGETISAGNSLETKHTGLLYSKDSNLSQLILRNTSGVGSFMDGEQIIGQDSGDTVYIGKASDWKDAPHHYIKKPINDNSGNLLSDATISYNALYIDEQNNDLGIDNPPDVIDTDLTPISNLEYETQLNDSRSKIRVVRPKMIYAFAQAYKKLLNA